MTEAIILAGGLGTRLRSVVPNTPKPMALVAGKPFLEWQLDYLISQGIETFIISTGYLSQTIENHFGDSYKSKEIKYSREETPLGTGGAIKMALSLASQDFLFVLNGDTFCNFPAEEMSKFQNKKGILIAIKEHHENTRYASIEFDKDSLEIKNFNNQCSQKNKWINCGVYFLSKNFFTYEHTQEVFSFEEHLSQISQNSKYAFPMDGYFIDIGIPEDYKKSQLLIPKWVK
ncbi:nucleotidyltransferase family protein [Comamonas aquatica]|uniref:nucleotidyltransferase family protein n=1 Tax=Comamonas aquatica TaxID=225991 RepID=UPI00244BE481|nr:nucleotidyltransferase family protein [Comamonas aquatica]MDH0898973.1 nucleotidyltransferase family protein [Comamonas aquatica]